jgi:hypothetical protein
MLLEKPVVRRFRMPNVSIGSETDDPSWRVFCRLGGATALIAVLVAPAEIIIGFLPGVARTLASTVTVVDWFTLFQNHWFLGLRSFGLLNLFGAVLLAPAVLAIYSAIRRNDEAYSAFATIAFFVGIAVYIASSRAFPMLSLSGQYASATTDAQRSLLVAAGQAMLAEGQNRGGVLLIEFAGFFVSVVMLRANIFSRMTACSGMLGNGLLMVVEVAFMPPHGVGMAIAACGGLSMMTWYALVGRRLLQLGRP